jgi:hypothetical protein
MEAVRENSKTQVNTEPETNGGSPGEQQNIGKITGRLGE